VEVTEISLLSLTTGRGGIYEGSHVEIRRQSKGARETQSDTPHPYAIIDFIEDHVDSFVGLDNIVN
jgi:hypothetical protein